MASHRTQIADQIQAQIAAAIPELRYCAAGQRPKIVGGDFNETELPAVQIIGGGESNIHEVKQGRKTWRVLVEVVIGPIAFEGYEPIERDLWDLMERIERAVMAKPKLSLAFVVQARLIGSEPDLALLHPLFSGRLEFEVEYKQPLVGSCADP